MRRFLTVFVLLTVAAVQLTAAEIMRFKLNNGTTLEGEINKSSFNKDGLMVREKSGRYSARVRWSQVSKESLQQLADNQDALPFIEALLEPPEEIKFEQEEKARQAARTIKIKPVQNRLDRPTPPSRFAALFVTPVGWVLFLLIWGGSLYASYEVAIFKNRPVAMVMPIAAVAPVIGPLVFFCMPAAPVKSAEEMEAEAAALAEGTEGTEGEAVVVVEEAQPVAEEAPAAPQFPPTMVCKRGQFIFNRRFFETKFAPYFKPVLGDAEKDMVLIIKSARGEFTGHRFSKLEANSIFLQTFKGAASEEVELPFVEVNEIILKHKDAPMP